jgi:hypothetical protein
MRIAYRKYIKSECWRLKRGQVHFRDKGECQARKNGIQCKARTREVHHLRYPRVLGTEPLEWLMLCCDKCHNAIHAGVDGYEPVYPVK